jgi:hypothetical protein
MKGHVGTTIATGRQLAAGNVPIRFQVAVLLTGQGAQRTVVDVRTRSIFTGTVYNVESKYTTNPAARPNLTQVQQKATQQVSNYVVSQSTSGAVGNISGLAAGRFSSCLAGRGC